LLSQRIYLVVKFLADAVKPLPVLPLPDIRPFFCVIVDRSGLPESIDRIEVPFSRQVKSRRHSKKSRATLGSGSLVMVLCV